MFLKHLTSEKDNQSSEPGDKPKANNDLSDDDDDSSNSSNSEVENRPKRIKTEEELENDRKKTLFLTQAPQSIADEAYLESFRNFGDIKYFSRLKQGEKITNKAFLCFSSVDGYDKCLESAKSNRNNKSDLSFLEIEGKRINVFPAVDRETASTIKLNNQIRNDPRNISLLELSKIDPETTKVSDEDNKFRIFIENQCKQKLENDGDKFVSPLRLHIHNLPSNHTNQSLKKILTLKLKCRRQEITEVKVIKSSAPKSSTTTAAFVAFNSHKRALSTLNILNNSKKHLGSYKIPLVVTFSIESKAALKSRARRDNFNKLGSTMQKKGAQ
ncbi:MAG: RNA-binding protein 28 [Paramarteilia canceri]